MASRRRARTLRRRRSGIRGRTRAHSGKAALAFEDFDLSGALDLLEPGRNLLANHALCESVDSPRLLVWPELVASTPVTEGRLVLNEIAPPGAAEFWLEIVNSGEKALNLRGHGLACDGATTGSYTFPEARLEPGGFFTLNEAALGFRPRAADRLFLFAPHRSAVHDAAVVADRLRGRAPDATGCWQFPAAPTPGAASR